MLMINSGCAAAGCIDAQSPIRASKAKLLRAAQADREFVKNLCMNRGYLPDGLASPSIFAPPSEKVVVQISCSIDVRRQKYLRSFQFTVVEEGSQETVARNQRVKKGLIGKPESTVNSFGDRNGSSTRPCSSLHFCVSGCLFLSGAKRTCKRSALVLPCS